MIANNSMCKYPLSIEKREDFVTNTVPLFSIALDKKIS
jgi:hypothetical protein